MVRIRDGIWAGVSGKTTLTRERQRVKACMVHGGNGRAPFRGFLARRAAGDINLLGSKTKRCFTVDYFQVPCGPPDCLRYSLCLIRYRRLGDLNLAGCAT